MYSSWKATERGFQELSDTQFTIVPPYKNEQSWNNIKNKPKPYMLGIQRTRESIAEVARGFFFFLEVWMFLYLDTGCRHRGRVGRKTIFSSASPPLQPHLQSSIHKYTQTSALITAATFKEDSPLLESLPERSPPFLATLPLNGLPQDQYPWGRRSWALFISHPCLEAPSQQTQKAHKKPREQPVSHYPQ